MKYQHQIEQKPIAFYFIHYQCFNDTPGIFTLIPGETIFLIDYYILDI